MTENEKKWVYSFGEGNAEGSAEMKNLLGGKGANLAQMCLLNLPVPPGFTITTEVCNQFYRSDRKYPKNLDQQVNHAIGEIEQIVQAKFGDQNNPLLLSVRSGGRASMPGMMDTVLNLGLNQNTVTGLANQSQDQRFAWDSYRRFIQMYANVVLGIDTYHFEDILENYKNAEAYKNDTDMNAEDWRKITDLYKKIIQQNTGEPFPEDTKTQLWGAIRAVFLSWQNPRAKTYRNIHAIPDHWGTAVTVQSMVFGNMNHNSATGVMFTRNPSNGEKNIYGEFLINAQGEDVVAGIRTPQGITQEACQKGQAREPSLEKYMPDAFRELKRIQNILEEYYKDMQDMEFTIQNNKLWMLQTRNGKRTAKAALKIAVDMVNEGMITKKEAVQRINPSTLDQLLHPTIDPNANIHIIARGLPASPGAAAGEIVFDSETAEQYKTLGKKTILVRIETNPEDIHGMHAAQAILTTRGGMTSHAAVVARGMGKPCVSGAGEIRIDTKNKKLNIGNISLDQGDIITIDGAAGTVMKGQVPMIQVELSDNFATIMKWADKIRRLKVRTNAETPLDAKTARNFGAEGIGLCRTEHMFFNHDRINAMRQMILSEDEEKRRQALKQILPMQKQDFVELFEIMEGLPVTIRLLDPPLHEFLPRGEDEIQNVAKSLNISNEMLQRRVTQLHEFNPMLGHRGVRLAISYPEIVEMQANAIFQAAAEIKIKTGKQAILEIMIPLITGEEEVKTIKLHIQKIARKIQEQMKISIDYQLGVMIELPRAAIMAEKIAQEAEFFSFGTNDLTQTTFGISRDDSANFMNQYLERKIFKTDPFISIDQDAVGELMKIATQKGRKTRHNLKIGICGEHGGESKSIEFCEEIGLDYVSCSPFRVPIARLAAAQAVLKKEK